MRKWTQRERIGYLKWCFDNCVCRVGKLNLAKCPSSNRGKVHPGRDSSCPSSTACLNEVMKPSVARRHRSSEQSQAAIVLQQEKEGSANAGWWWVLYWKIWSSQWSTKCNGLGIQTQEHFTQKWHFVFICYEGVKVLAGLHGTDTW